MDSPVDTPPLPACNNGMDDDHDGLIDGSNPGCDSVTDDSERSQALICDNGLDDDNDGRIDVNVVDLSINDPGCASPDDGTELGIKACDDGMDNDNDGRTDFKLDPLQRDPGCDSPDDDNEKCLPGGSCPQCDDNTDNDADTTLDFNTMGTGDPSCTSPDDSPE